MPRRLTQLLSGLVLYGVADALIIRASIGVDPWTVFAQGVSAHTGIGIGWLTNIIGFVVLLLWIPLRQRPGLGTVLNILIIGPSIELGLWLIPVTEELWIRVPLFAAGLFLLAIASGLYIGAALGPGPRDGLMTGIHTRFGWPIWAGRTAVEVSVVTVGWMLGGQVGAGTLAFALLVGPLVGVTLRWFSIPRFGRDVAGAEAPGASATATDLEAEPVEAV